jgi:hypothetical protein
MGISLLDKWEAHPISVFIQFILAWDIFSW